MTTRLIMIMLLTALPLAALDRAVVRKITDGDTIIVRDKGREIHVRLIGIDAPESSENIKSKRQSGRTGRDMKIITAQGKKATAFLRSVIRRGDTVELEYDSERFDRYGRTLAYVYLTDGRMLNELIIESGYATHLTIPPNVRYREKFRKAWQRAKQARRGLWSGE